MNPLPSDPAPGGLSITAAERETGLSKDTLRVWERRYGFPRPLRDASDDRLYPLAQVERLQRIRRLLDAGHRPGKVVALNEEAIQALLDQSPTLSKTNKSTEALSESLDVWLTAIEAHDVQALRHALSHAQMRMGLRPFVTDVVAPLTTAVGEAWAQGRFQVFEEHLYTEVVTSVLRSGIAALTPPPTAAQPRVLLTTLPQELHGLGLLMVEALLALDGCLCISLGTQTPISDIVRAVQAHHIDVVALSFTNMHGSAVVHASLRTLRSELPPNTAIWVGGACAALYQKPLTGISTCAALAGLEHCVQEWRQTHANPAS